MPLCILKAIFAVVGAVCSIFYGLCYRELWFDMTANQLKAWLNEKGKGCPWLCWQFLQNFAGGAVGWSIAYYYVFHRAWWATFPQVGDSVPILIALLGIMGFLPFVLSKVSLAPSLPAPLPTSSAEN